MEYKYSHTVLGGTFDHLHKGHEHFLTEAFKASSKVTIGITADRIVLNKKNSSSIENFEVRKKQVTLFLRKKGFSKRAKIVKIDDIFGTTLKDKTLDSLFVIPETLENGNKVNKERSKMGLKTLKITIVQTIPSNDGSTISSTRIRSGEIDREGNLYSDLFRVENLTLPDALRPILRKPFGKIVRNPKPEGFIIAIGDIVVSTLISNGITPNVSVFDGISDRRVISDKMVLYNLPNQFKSEINDPGTINAKSVIALEKLIRNSVEKNLKNSLKIVGEEDLLAIPAILLAPLGSKVVYGLKGKGAVMVDINEEVKKLIKDKVMSKFH